MPLLLQICVVIVTMSLVAIAVVTVRAMRRFERATDEFTVTAAAIRSSLAQTQEIAGEARQLVRSLGEVAPQVRAIAARFASLSDRTARLSTAVLDEVEAPIRSAVALARGMRQGTRFLFDRLAQRMAHHSSPTNGGFHHERESIHQ